MNCLQKNKSGSIRSLPQPAGPEISYDYVLIGHNTDQDVLTFFLFSRIAAKATMINPADKNKR